MAHDDDRIAAYADTLSAEVALWLRSLRPQRALRHLHFGGGSPNALAPRDFLRLVQRIVDGFGLQAGAEIAVELDPGTLSDAFIGAIAESGVTRASLGVQSFDPGVQAKVNRIQPLELVASAVGKLRAAGVAAINFDLMYGLPGQCPDNVAATARRAAQLRPDRLAVFGYAHVPWAKKHQTMIDEAALADSYGRWLQADAADAALLAAGYAPIGLDHYALPGDLLALAAASGALKRNFQGYTVDPAPILVPLGASAIGRSPGMFVQNAVRTDAWSDAVRDGRLPLHRELPVTADDALRGSIIERLMCDLVVDVGAVCQSHGRPPGALDDALACAALLQSDGLCVVAGRTVTVPAAARRVVRAVAACFDAHLQAAEGRHAKAV